MHHATKQMRNMSAMTYCPAHALARSCGVCAMVCVRRETTVHSAMTVANKWSRLSDYCMYARIRASRQAGSPRHQMSQITGTRLSSACSPAPAASPPELGGFWADAKGEARASSDGTAASGGLRLAGAAASMRDAGGDVGGVPLARRVEGLGDTRGIPAYGCAQQSSLHRQHGPSTNQ